MRKVFNQFSINFAKLNFIRYKTRKGHIWKLNHLDDTNIIINPFQGSSLIVLTKTDLISFPFHQCYYGKYYQFNYHTIIIL